MLSNPIPDPRQTGVHFFSSSTAVVTVRESETLVYCPRIDLRFILSHVPPRPLNPAKEFSRSCT